MIHAAKNLLVGLDARRPRSHSPSRGCRERSVAHVNRRGAARRDRRRFSPSGRRARDSLDAPLRRRARGGRRLAKLPSGRRTQKTLAVDC